MSGGNPFTRFAFAASADEDVKTETTPQLAVKRLRTERKTSPNRPSKFIKSEAGVHSINDTSRRLELLLELFEARKDKDTPIDKYGTHACVATGVTSTKVERFQLLVAALLSSQTQDQITFAAMQRLHQLGENNQGLTIETVQTASEETLSELLQPVGFYHRKANQLKRVAAILHTQFHGDIPRSLDELQQLPGIGPKIGRVITLLAWGRVDGIVVDTHVHRLSQRLGWASTKTAEDTRKELEDWIPREHWGKLSHGVVGFGQTVCTAKHPTCSSCPLVSKCPSTFKVESRRNKTPH